MATLSFAPHIRQVVCERIPVGHDVDVVQVPAAAPGGWERPFRDMPDPCSLLIAVRQSRATLRRICSPSGGAGSQNSRRVLTTFAIHHARPHPSSTCGLLQRMLQLSSSIAAPRRETVNAFHHSPHRTPGDTLFRPVRPRQYSSCRASTCPRCSTVNSGLAVGRRRAVMTEISSPSGSRSTYSANPGGSTFNAHSRRRFCRPHPNAALTYATSFAACA